MVPVKTQITELTSKDARAIATLLQHDGGYSMGVNTRPSERTDVDDLLYSRPPGTAPDQKHVLGLWADDELVAVADVITGWPEQHTNWVGLLQVHEAHTGRGHARALHDELLRRFPAPAWRLAVVDSNDRVVGFWERLGYRATGENRPWTSASGEAHETILMQATTTGG